MKCALLRQFGFLITKHKGDADCALYIAISNLFSFVMVWNIFNILFLNITTYMKLKTKFYKCLHAFPSISE